MWFMNVIFMDFGQLSIEGLGLPKGDLLTGEEKNKYQQGDILTLLFDFLSKGALSRLP